MIGAGVDDEWHVTESIRVLTRLTVREGEEDDVVPRQDLGSGVLQSQMCQRAQVRLMLDQRLARRSNAR